MSYAEKTTVSFDKSVAEIISLVRRAGAGQIGQFEGEDFFAVQFVLDARQIRFRLPIPSLGEMPTHDGRRSELSDTQRQNHLVQARRSRGRALLLVIKAKLESVESGIETVEQAFLANVVMANGQTVYDRIRNPISIEYETGKVGPMMLEGPKS